MLRRLSLKCALIAAITLLITFLISGFLIKDTVEAAQNQQQPSPNAGSLQAFDRKGNAAGECPLKHTTVKAEVSGFLSRVTVTQDFENPFTEKIEAFYTFPLPQAAAVDDLTMQIGGRTVKGQIMRRKDAETAYAAAKQLGKVATLLDQERPNIFTQSVANIMPGQQIRIVISYVETLKYDDGSYEWSFPMVVGPRYLSSANESSEPNESESEEPATSNAEPVDAPRTPPSETMGAGLRPGHDISLEIAIDAGLPIESLDSETHETQIQRPDANHALVQLKDLTTIPNKDFVLKYHVAGSAINDAVLTHRSDRGGFFTLILQPPQRVAPEDVMPKELVFVLDTSGSMSGFPFEKARETMLLALDTLNPHDTFNVITFSGDTNILFDEPVPASPENLEKAKQFLNGRQSNGGTEMMKAIKAALKPSDSQQHLRIACFMTDGWVGDDMKIIAEVKKHKNARVFSMGFGSAPNRFLLDNMAEFGRGEVDYVPEKGNTSAAAKRFNDRIRNPLLTDISIDWSTLPVAEVYPKRVPDLFSAKPLIVSGRYLNGATGTITLRGKSGGQDFVREIPVQLPGAENEHDVLATLWARRKVDDLMGDDMDGAQSGSMKAGPREEITQLGLRFKLMTQFTSFVAIDDVLFTGVEPARQVEVPQHPVAGLAVPAGTVASGVSAVVDVSASSSPMSADASLGTTVTARSIAELPLNGRSIQNYVLLVPGVVEGHASQVPVASPVDLSSNGQRPNSNMFMVDGVSGNFGIVPGGQNVGSSAAGSGPALTASGGANGLAQYDSVQELQIKTSYTQPEYGRIPGAQVKVITRAGTNNFHGSLFHFFGNDSLDANDWFANSRDLDKPVRRLNNFGGTFGGPIVRDKAFFFSSYEGLRLRQPSTGITDVPSFTSRASAVAEMQPFLNAFPLPTGAARPDGFAEYAATFANRARHDAGSIRADVIRDRSSFSGKYTFAESEADERGAGGFSLNTTGRIRSFAQTVTGSLSQTLSPTKILELRANYSRLRVAGSYALDEFGGAVVPEELLPGSAFNFDLNARGANLIAGDEVANVQRQFNANGSLNVVSGDHNYIFGGDYRRMSPSLGMRTVEQGVLFNGVDQALTGIAARATLFTREAAQNPVFNNLSLYAQDEWRTTSRLTLNYGLRWELNPPPSNDGTQPVERLWQTTYLNLAPRFGFAYQFFGDNDPKFVVRGGVGVHYDLGNERAGDVFVDSIPFVNGVGSPLLTFDPHLKLPYALNWNFSIERQLGDDQLISASYVGAAGRRLLHTQTLLDESAAFPFRRLTMNEGRSDYRALQVEFNRRYSDGLTSVVSYTWARSLDNVSEDSARNVLMTSADAELDRGPSDFDTRHQFKGFVSYELPALLSSGWGNRIFRNWSTDSIFKLRSAKPVNVVYMIPTSFGAAYFRPDVIAGQPLYLFDASVAGGRRINPTAFITPPDGDQGNLSRNSIRGFPLYQIDLALRRRFNFTESLSIQLQADAFNLFNHPNFEDPLGRDRIIGSTFVPGVFTPNSTFGQSTSLYGQNLSTGAGAFGSFYNSGGPRALRFSVKLIF
jgi:Ca-activated chloride channel family protein